MLTTAQPKGRRYCTLHWFFFSPAPILPAQRAQQNKPLGKISPSSWQDLKRKSYLFVLCARQCRRLFLDRCCPDPEETREAFKRIESRDEARVHHQHSIVFFVRNAKVDTHHKQRALSLCLLRRLGQPAFVQPDKEPFTVCERRETEDTQLDELWGKGGRERSENKVSRMSSVEGNGERRLQSTKCDAV